MHLGIYIPMLLGLTVMAQDSYGVYKKCNRSFEYMKSYQSPVNFFHPQLRAHLAQGIPYIPEEEYVEKYEQEQQPHDRDNRNLLPEYRRLCEIVAKNVRLDDSEYEYQPPQYNEIYCKSYSMQENLQQTVNPPKQTCVHAGFRCVQRSKTLVLVRRRWDSECWEPFIKEIASGCDCMWPVSVLGDITDHY
ncbi:unnamed protein product [Xylocopa violacea]|uniref:Uncharacterized protein n=1 Tax=Xylocopa violacea TaxID=135666 RepID=A0ABP1NMD7_XYLVO